MNIVEGRQKCKGLKERKEGRKATCREIESKRLVCTERYKRSRNKMKWKGKIKICNVYQRV